METLEERAFPFVSLKIMWKPFHFYQIKNYLIPLLVIDFQFSGVGLFDQHNLSWPFLIVYNISWATNNDRFYPRSEL